MRGEIRRILVAADISEAAEPLLAAAGDIARQLRAEVIVLHMVDLGDYVTIQRETGMALDDYLDEVRRQLRGRAGRSGLGADVALELTAGRDAAQEIIRAAHQAHADLILMGTHARRGIQRALIGSVAEAVLRHADCPVLIVPVAALWRPAPEVPGESIEAGAGEAPGRSGEASRKR